MAGSEEQKGQSGSQVELEGLLLHAEQQSPGVVEMMRIYQGYQQVLRTMEAYLEPTRPRPFVTTSNGSWGIE